MKPRGEDETDAHYIRRLEAALKDTRAHNARMKKVQDRLFDAIIPAAQQAGLVLQYAAEITGMKDDPVTAHSIAALKQLAECGWSRDGEVLVMPIIPKLPRPAPERFAGDVEMILKSALEQAKAFNGPFNKQEHLYPKVAELSEDADWEVIQHEIWDAMSNFEFCRDMLRMDLRSTMYDHCFRRICEAVNAGYRRSERSQPYPPAFSVTVLGTTDDDKDLPF